MKFILLRAFVKRNLGDDLFIKTICERYPNQKFVLVGDREDLCTLNDITNLRCVAGDAIWFKIWNRCYVLGKKLTKKYIENNRNIFVVSVLSRFAKANVYVTGSYFREPPRWHGLIDQRWYQANSYILGCNFGPYTSTQFFDSYYEQFQKVAQISFRDRYSYELFKELPNAMLSTDLVFGMNRREEIKNLGYYIVTVVDVSKDDVKDSNRIMQDYIYKMVQIVTYLFKQNKEVRFFSFCEAQGDLDVISQITSRLPQDVSYTIFNYRQLGMQASLNMIAESEGVIATRYHAMILGILYEKKVFPIIYNEKMEHLLEDIKFEGEVVTIEQIQSLELTNLIERMQSYPKEGLVRLREQAQLHYAKLDQYLRSKHNP